MEPEITSLAKTQVLIDEGAPSLERLAAQEVCRYLFLLTGVYPPLVSKLPETGPIVAVGAAAMAAAERAGGVAGLEALGEQEIFLRTVTERSRPLLLLTGGSPAAVQWAVYAFLEHLGFGFFLGGDAIPTAQPDLAVPWLEVREQPAFEIRGTLPWYNFLNSPTVWNLGDHRRFYDQLAKQRANFVGFHSYDYEPWAAYPDAHGRLRSGLPLCTSGSHAHIWGAVPTPTSEYAFGSHQLYSRDLFGAEVALDYQTPQAGIEQQQAMLAEALTYARSRGIHPCVGFEVQGDPEAPDNVTELRLRIQHLARRYPLDYLWIWQAEGRGGAGILRPPRDLSTAVDTGRANEFSYLEDPWRIAEGIRISKYATLAHSILQEVAPQVRLILSGWGGDQWMRFTDFYEGLDRTLPVEIIFAALDNIDPTFESNLSAVYGKLRPERQRWPIPWFESDGGGTRRDQWGPQPNVHAFAPLLSDARTKGCQGILGIHWRTRAVEEVAAYTFQWPWQPNLTPEAFFARFSTACYGPKRAARLAHLHGQLERLGPRWTGAMGQVECGSFTWFSLSGHQIPTQDAIPPFRAGQYPRTENLTMLTLIEHAIEAELADLASAERRPRERLEYLLRTLRWVMKYDAAARILYPDGPVEAALRRAEEAISTGHHEDAQQAITRLRESGLREAIQILAGNITNQGELGVLATINGKAVAAYKGLIHRLEKILGEPIAAPLLAAGAWPEQGQVLTLVTPDTLRPGEPLTLEVRAVGPAPIARVIVRYRHLDSPPERAWEEQPLRHLRRAVYRGELSVPAPGLAYAIEAIDSEGRISHAPVAWPDLNYTTTVWPDS